MVIYYSLNKTIMLNTDKIGQNFLIEERIIATIHTPRRGGFTLSKIIPVFLICAWWFDFAGWSLKELINCKEIQEAPIIRMVSNSQSGGTRGIDIMEKQIGMVTGKRNACATSIKLRMD